MIVLTLLIKPCEIRYSFIYILLLLLPQPNETHNALLLLAKTRLLLRVPTTTLATDAYHNNNIY